MQRFYRAHYTPQNMIVAVAGNLDHASVVRMVRKAFGRSDFLADRSVTPLPVRSSRSVRRTTPGEVVASRPFEQVNLVLGVNGLIRTDERRYALGVLNAALGGGTSSRLFQEVRERRGLAYSVYSYAAHLTDAGTFAVALGCLPSRATEVLSVVRTELDRLGADGISAEELRRGQGQLCGGMVLALEDSGSRMSRIAKAELLYDELPSIDEVLRRISAVTLEDVNALAAQLFRQKQTLAVVGPSGVALS